MRNSVYVGSRSTVLAGHSEILAPEEIHSSCSLTCSFVFNKILEKKFQQAPFLGMQEDFDGDWSSVSFLSLLSEKVILGPDPQWDVRCLNNFENLFLIDSRLNF